MIRRNTKQRQMILEVIQGEGKHMHAEDVYKALPEDANVGLATVYRNLNLLCEEGVIRKIAGDHFSFYDGNPKPHDHFYCVCCGSIMDVERNDESLQISSLPGVSVLSHTVTYEGICQNCLKEEEKQWN